VVQLVLRPVIERNGDDLSSSFDGEILVNFGFTHHAENAKLRSEILMLCAEKVMIRAGFRRILFLPYN
jgi:hypothetical protein